MSEWISVNDRLPEMSTLVALLSTFTHLNTGDEGFECNWAGAGWLYPHGHNYWHVIGEIRAIRLDSVTHWMPLPPPPEEKP